MNKNHHRKQHIGEEEKSVTAEEISIDVPKSKNDDVQATLKKHDRAWFGRLGEQCHWNAYWLGTGFQTVQVPTVPCETKDPRARTHGNLQAAEGRRHLAGHVRVGRSGTLCTRKGVKLRFCIDYRKLNSMTIRNTNALPRIDSFIVTIGKLNYFTMLNAYSGYGQTDIIQRLSATRESMPFGLTIVPACFRRALVFKFTRFKRKNCVVCVDEVIIFSNTYCGRPHSSSRRNAHHLNGRWRQVEDKQMPFLST